MPELTDYMRQRFTKIANSDASLGAIRGMIYNNLQEWKRLIYKANPANDTDLGVHGEAWDGMRLSQGDTAFIQQEMAKIITQPFTDDFLKAIAHKTKEDIEGASKRQSLTVHQENLLADCNEVLTGEPF